MFSCDVASSSDYKAVSDVGKGSLCVASLRDEIGWA
jgi:hypothetical protein